MKYFKVAQQGKFSTQSYCGFYINGLQKVQNFKRYTKCLNPSIIQHYKQLQFCNRNT